MTRQAQSTKDFRSKILLLGIQAPYNTISDIQSYFDEFVNLVKSNNISYDEELFISLREIDPATFITKGKLEKLSELIEKKDIDEIIISEPLTTQQERNLFNYLHCKIYDRTDLILEIFEKNARSIEGKTQVAIAYLQHKKSRLAGKGVHMSQQAGFMGLRAGPGETQKEREKRHIESEILKLKKDLKKIQQTRSTQRKQRLLSQEPLVCLIGYTNAGKSTILNTLTKADVLAADRLFATLDTTTKQLFINGKKRGLLSDTVGFIQLLPPKLIEAFKSTLSELEYADLLLHVVDIADPNWEDHTQVVQEIIEDLDLEKEVLYVFNKVDKIELTPRLQDRIDRYLPNVLINATTKKGIEPLINFLDWWLPKK